MSNWRTAKRVIQERVHRFGSADPNIAGRALCEAIGHYASMNLYINQETYDFDTVDGTPGYGPESADGVADGYPADMLKPIHLALQVSSSWYTLENISIDYYRDLFVSNQSKGFPERWCWFSEEILLEPTPSGEYSVRLDYIKDLGSPTASFDGTSWSFTVGGSAIAEDYTNRWFVEGLDLITARGVYYVASQYLGDKELTMFSKAHEVEALRELQESSEAVDISPNPRPFE